jgi:hypothetical protein
VIERLPRSRRGSAATITRCIEVAAPAFPYPRRRPTSEAEFDSHMSAALHTSGHAPSPRSRGCGSLTFEPAQRDVPRSPPACLERKLNRGVDNGGVFGYGAAQSLLRASIELGKKNYSSLVFSVLVGTDFKRDRLSYRGGFAKPALVRTNNGIEWSAVPDPNRPGTLSNPASPNRLIAYLYERSMVAAAVVNRLKGTSKNSSRQVATNLTR